MRQQCFTSVDVTSSESHHYPASSLAAAICIGLFAILLLLFRRAHRGVKSVYFDAQDFVHFESGGGRELTKSAASGTFEQLLKHYVGVTQILVTVAAASIAFGGGQVEPATTKFAKVCLAFSILFGVSFCATMLYRYDEYSQNVRSYTAFWYALTETLGFACLACFFLGYFVWAIGL